MTLPALTDPAIQLAVAVLLITALLNILLRRMLKRLLADAEVGGSRHHGLRWFVALATPINLLVWYYGLYAVARVLMEYTLPPSLAHYRAWLQDIAGLGAFIAFTWMIDRSTRLASAQLQAAAAATPGKVDDVALPLLGLALRVLLPIVALFFLVRLWPFPPTTVELLRKLIGIALIIAMAWIFRRAVLLTERVVISEKSLKFSDYAGRALATRISVLRKITLVLITIFSLAGVLMMFDEVRDVGRSILASAGVAGIVLGFAAQRSLGGLFAGLQIALTQPVRIGDQIMVQEQVGNVEEITLTYVVVRIWDQRRLILPISYLIENSIINYTRGSAEMQAPVTLRVDFTLPVAEFRAHMTEVVKTLPSWDKRNFGVQVTDAKHESMEIRLLASAATPGAAFQLQCDLREKAIEFIHLRYPQCLPKAREEGKAIQTWQASEEFGERPPLPPERNSAAA